MTALRGTCLGFTHMVFELFVAGGPFVMLRERGQRLRTYFGDEEGESERLGAFRRWHENNDATPLPPLSRGERPI